VLAAAASESLEQTGVVEALRARPLVFDPEHEAARGCGLGTDVNRAARGAELARVREQVHDDLRQTLVIAANHGHVGRELHLEPLATLLDQRLDELARRNDDFLDRDVLTPYAEL